MDERIGFGLYLLDVSLYLGCGGVGGESVGGLNQGLEGWGSVIYV